MYGSRGGRSVSTLEAAEEEELSLLEEAKGFVDEAKAAQAADLEEAAAIMGKDDLAYLCIFATQVPQPLLLPLLLLLSRPIFFILV